MALSELQSETRKAITNAYYNTRNAGGTMEDAADNAARGVMAALFEAHLVVELEPDGTCPLCKHSGIVHTSDGCAHHVGYNHLAGFEECGCPLQGAHQ